MSLIDQTVEWGKETNPDRDYEFWRTHDGNALVWSNPHTSDEVMIYNALLRPSFHLLLDIAVRFGFNRLTRQWAALKRDMTHSEWPDERRDIARATPIVERCLKHIRQGMARGSGTSLEDSEEPIGKRVMVRQRREAILQIAQRFGAFDVRLFGSAARGDEQPDSDLDFLVKMQPGRSLLDRARLTVALEELLACKVDVVNEAGLKARFIAQVQPDLVPV